MAILSSEVTSWNMINLLGNNIHWNDRQECLDVHKCEKCNFVLCGGLDCFLILFEDDELKSNIIWALETPNHHKSWYPHWKTILFLYFSVCTFYLFLMCTHYVIFFGHFKISSKDGDCIWYFSKPILCTSQEMHGDF